MNWEAAMRWARLRARDTGKRHYVIGYRTRAGWAYAVGRAR